MTHTVYVIGGAAAGKSTFMAQLLLELDADLGPLEDLWSAPNSRGTTITLRGHRWAASPQSKEGVYLGCMREHHPGTDGLDRVSSVAAVEWARGGKLPPVVVGEGLNLAHQGFLEAVPNVMLVHLVASPAEVARRCELRGTTQAASFVAGTHTRARNFMAGWRGSGLVVNTEDESATNFSLELVADWANLG